MWNYTFLAPLPLTYFLTIFYVVGLRPYLFYEPMWFQKINHIGS
jgi:hypothetical protein